MQQTMMVMQVLHTQELTRAHIQGITQVPKTIQVIIQVPKHMAEPTQEHLLMRVHTQEHLLTQAHIQVTIQDITQEHIQEIQSKVQMRMSVR